MWEPDGGSAGACVPHTGSVERESERHRERQIDRDEHKFGICI
eukprot:COSAG02_NODE_60143_length_272_cov_0.601156_1_plen_42_part_01